MREERQEQDWASFRYIAGEMNAEEVTDFEDQLANDQDSRESVAATVELTEALAMLPLLESNAAQPTTSKADDRRLWNTRATWMGIGAAACLVLVMVTQAARNDVPETNEPLSPTASENLNELATAWSETALHDEEQDVVIPEELVSLPEITFDGEAESDSAIPPPWMLAAISEDAMEIMPEMGMSEQLP